MRPMGLRVIYQKPRTTLPGEPSERFPCLVDLKQVRAADQIWATDITYIPLQKGFLYLVAIVDLFSRNVLSQLEALEQFLSRCPGDGIGRWSQAKDLPLRSGLPIHLF